MKKFLKLVFLVIVILVVIVSVWLSKKYIKTESTDYLEEENGKVYSIENKNFNLFEIDNDREEEYQGIKLYEYDNTKKDYSEIFYISYDYYTDFSSSYNLLVKDLDGKSLLIDEELNKYGEAQMVGGMISSVKIKKLDLNSKIIFEAIERDYETKDIVNSKSVQIDLSKDLELKEVINQESLQQDEILEDVKFKHTEDEYFYNGTTAHAYSKDLKGRLMSWSVLSQYGNNLVKEKHIDFSMEKNVNNLSLEDAFEALMLINNNLGQYGLSDIYGINFFDENGEFTGEECIFSFEEILKIAKGQSVTKNKKDYTKEDFYFADVKFSKICDTTIGNGISAIKYKAENNDSENYMFIYKNNIYYINCPIGERTEKVVEMFLNSLELN